MGLCSFTIVCIDTKQKDSNFIQFNFNFRAIAAVEDPADVFVVSSRPYGQRAVLKFARYIGSTAIAGRYTPGMFFDTLMSKSSLFGFVDTYE